jgi:hypothetical protein
MAGSDTWRGIDFQAAYTVALALDVLSGEAGETLAVDPGPDIVDYSTREQDRTLRVLGQAKTRSERYTWPPGELVSIIKRLAAVPDSDSASIEFVTDGALSPDTLALLLPAIARAARSEADDQDWAYLAGHDISPADESILARINVLSGYDTAGAQLDRAVRRVRAMRDLNAPVTDEEAERLLLLLLRAVTERGTSTDAPQELTRREIGEIIGVPPETVDAALPWSPELAERQRQLITAAPIAPEIIELSVQASELTAAYEQLLSSGMQSARIGGVHERREVRPTLDLLAGDAAILGPTGAGKSTTFEGLRRRAAEEGLTPVLLNPVSYRSGGLPALVRQQLSVELGVQMGPGAGVAILRRSDTVLLIDGAGEQSSPEMATALARDVAELRSQLHAPTVILAARSLSTLRPFNLPAWEMKSLDRSSRREIASALIGDEQRAGELCALLESRIAGPVENPLLFRMALGLAVAKRPPQSVGEIFSGFLDGLHAKAAPGLDWSLAIPCVGAVCAEMVAAESFARSRWDWLISLEQIVESLRERGLSGNLTAAEIADAMYSAGVLVPADSGGELSLLHDSFRDWFAAQAIKAATATLPERIATPWKSVAGYLAEAGADEQMLLCFCADPEVATHAASMESRGEADDCAALASAAFSRLSEHLGPELRAGVEGMRIHATEERGRLKLLLIPDDGAENLAAALMGTELPSGSGPLACASALWLEHIRSSLRARPTVPDQIPTERTELAAAIEARFHAQREELARLASTVLPGLGERVLTHAGWSGLEGCIGAVSEDREERMHPFSYRYGASATSVSVEDEDEANMTTQTTAEHWLQGNAREAALTAFRVALADLLTGFNG